MEWSFSYILYPIAKLSLYNTFHFFHGPETRCYKGTCHCTIYSVSEGPLIGKDLLLYKTESPAELKITEADQIFPALHKAFLLLCSVLFVQTFMSPLQTLSCQTWVYSYEGSLDQLVSRNQLIWPGGYKTEFIFKLKIKRNDWLFADRGPQALNHCALFEFETVLKFYNREARILSL